eukprot:2269705-Amphidinium_carterae.1
MYCVSYPLVIRCMIVRKRKALPHGSRAGGGADTESRKRTISGVPLGLAHTPPRGRNSFRRTSLRGVISHGSRACDSRA